MVYGEVFPFHVSPFIPLPKNTEKPPKMARQNRNPPWSDLPQELLSTIANFLTSNPISIFTFRSICHSWRSSCPPLSNSPILSPLLPFSIPLPLHSYTPFYDDSSSSFISVTIIYALPRPLQLSQGGLSSLSPDAWILFVDEFIPGKLSIRKPFSNESYSTPINFPNNVNLIDSGFRELGRFHNLTYSTYYDYDEIRRCKRSKPRFWDIDVNKVVMFPNEIAAVTLRDDGTLGMYRLNAGINEGITKCESKHDGKGFRFDDIVEYKGRVLGIDRRGRVYQINYHSSEMTPFVAPIAGGGGRRKRLVESLGRLYLVVRCYVDPGHNNKWNRLKLCGPDGVKEEIRKIRFKVYELNEGKKKWIEISSLGDRSFSFGRNFSFSASAQELGTCVKNCILFTRHSFLSYSSNDDDFTGFGKCELDIGVCHLHEADHFGDIKSYPGYSDSLWPPPSWMWSIDRLNRIGIVETAIEGLLDKVPENYKTDVERAAELKPTVLEFVMVILKLKKMVINFKEEEIAFKIKLRQAMDIFDQVDGLFEQAKTWSHMTTEETCGNPDNWKTSQACHESLLRLTLGMLRIRDSYLLYIEEDVTHVEMSLKSRLAAVLTLAQ